MAASSLLNFELFLFIGISIDMFKYVMIIRVFNDGFILWKNVLLFGNDEWIGGLQVFYKLALYWHFSYRKKKENEKNCEFIDKYSVANFVSFKTKWSNPF